MSDTFWGSRPLCEWNSVDSPSIRVPEDLEPGELFSIMAPDLSVHDLHERNWVALGELLS